MSGGGEVPGVVRLPHRLRPDPARVLARLFVPGQELVASGESRASAVLERIMAMPADEVTATLAATLVSFGPRHRHLEEVLAYHFDLVAHRLGGRADPSPERRLLIGAYFTNENSIEGAALCNPSIVLHPDQEGLREREARLVMSLRAVGEGHLSCIEFRTGVVGPGPDVRIDDPGRFLVAGRHQTPRYERELFRRLLAEEGDDGESAAFVLDALPELFAPAELEAALSALGEQSLTRSYARETIERFERMAVDNYGAEFPDDTSISERVLWPVAPAESHGMEDARFVRFVDDGRPATYYATYTAFDGVRVAPQLLETNDFRTFRMTQLTGPAAKNKGMALFPRRVGGRYAALSRWDRESNAIAFSADLRAWGEAETLQSPEHPWELLQLGNCGSPIETPEGWLVLTHGVGPMRVYAIGALLLDLDDPTRVRARLAEPLLLPDDSERDGYVPNVVYSCGALVHDGTLVLPYGIGDREVGIATVPLGGLIDRLVGARSSLR